MEYYGKLKTLYFVDYTEKEIYFTLTRKHFRADSHLVDFYI